MQKPFSSNSFYFIERRSFTENSVTKITKITLFPHGGKSEIFSLPYVLDLPDLLEQKIYQDSNLRVKLMYDSVK